MKTGQQSSYVVNYYILPLAQLCNDRQIRSSRESIDWILSFEIDKFSKFCFNIAPQSFKIKKSMVKTLLQLNAIITESDMFIQQLTPSFPKQPGDFPPGDRSTGSICFRALRTPWRHPGKGAWVLAAIKSPPCICTPKKCDGVLELLIQPSPPSNYSGQKKGGIHLPECVGIFFFFLQNIPTRSSDH